jgi:hypothetical protein
MRITKEVKAIADAHIEARETKSFNPVPIKNREELLAAMRAGYTFEKALETIEMRFCPITSKLLTTRMEYNSKSYISGVYKGFKILFQSEKYL